MSTREKIAAMAMQAILSNPVIRTNGTPEFAEKAAAWAVESADQLILKLKQS